MPAAVSPTQGRRQAGSQSAMLIPFLPASDWSLEGIKPVLDELSKDTCFLLESNHGSLRRKRVSVPFFPMGRHAERVTSALADTRRQALSVAEDGGMQRQKEAGFLRAVPAPALHHLPQGLNLPYLFQTLLARHSVV